MMKIEFTMDQMENVTGGMYHGYARPNGNGIIAGMPPHDPNGVMGPGLGYRPATVEKLPYGNLMTSGFFADMRPGMMGPGMKKYNTTEKKDSSTEE